MSLGCYHSERYTSYGNNSSHHPIPNHSSRASRPSSFNFQRFQHSVTSAYRNQSFYNTFEFMPTISYRSKIKAVADLYAVSLNVRHRLVVGKPSDMSYTTTRFPEDVDVLASSFLVTISGSFDGSRISAADVETSSLAQHIASYFRTSAAELGLSTVSGVYTDDDDEVVKVLLTSSRQYPPIKSEMRPHALLVALELDFCWRTIDSSHSTSNKENQLNIASRPFSRKLSLPFRGLLDNVIKRFITWQCVKRYPLIFGPWCQQLDIETSYFPAIFRSILSIVERSSNESFRHRCHRLIKILRHQHMINFAEASSSLSNLADSDGALAAIGPQVPSFTDEEILHHSMERLYRYGLRRPQFKGLTRGPTADKADDEELSQDHNCLPASYFDDQLLLDDIPTSDARSPASRSLIDSNLSDDRHLQSTPSLFMDMELDCTDDFLLQHGNPEDLDSDCERENQCHKHLPRLPQMPIDLCAQQDRDIASAMIDFSDSDNSCDFPVNYDLQLRHRYAKLNTAAESGHNSVARDHITVHPDQISQDYPEQSLRMGQGSKGVNLSTSSRFPSVAVFYQDASSCTAQDTEALSPKSPLDYVQYMCKGNPLAPYWVAEWSTQLPNSCPLDDDADVLLLSDADISALNDTSYEDCYDLEEFDGMLGYGPKVSQHSPTTLITCPHRNPGYRVEEEQCGCGELGLLDGSLDGVRVQDCGAKLELEEDMLVVDF